jgi:hypothetical protein
MQAEKETILADLARWPEMHLKHWLNTIKSGQTRSPGAHFAWPAVEEIIMAAKEYLDRKTDI